MKSIFSFRVLALLAAFTRTHSQVKRPFKSGVAASDSRLWRWWWKRHRQRRIVGGIEAEVGRYPYMVSLVRNNAFVCGGTLIDPRWVLTAGHCGRAHDDSADAALVLLGHHRLSEHNEIDVDADGYDGALERIKVTDEIRHPNYNAHTMANDLLLLRLETPSSRPPVTLAAEGERYAELETGTNVTVIGWGTTRSGGPSVSDELREVEVRIVNRTACNEAYDRRIDRTMTCAAAPGKDSCQGDSGGPLFLKGDDASEDLQVGVVSWGIGCACEEYPGVYANVPELIRFVNDTVTANETELEEIMEEEVNLVCKYPDDGYDYVGAGCIVDVPCYLGDGWCDFNFISSSNYNTEICNNDGGDCVDVFAIGTGFFNLVIALPFLITLLI